MPVFAGSADTDLASPDNAGDMNRMMHAKTLKSYGEVQVPITVKGDSTGLIVQVPEQVLAPSQAAH